jgi:hypothetical protein
MSHHQKAGQSHNIKLANWLCGTQGKLKYVGMTVTTSELDLWGNVE